MIKPLTVTIKQACQMTGLGRSTIYRLFDEGRLKKRKAGKRTLILVKDLEAYVNALNEVV